MYIPLISPGPGLDAAAAPAGPLQRNGRATAAATSIRRRCAAAEVRGGWGSIILLVPSGDNMYI